MKGERLYEEIEAKHLDHHLEDGPTMYSNRLRLGRFVDDTDTAFLLYYFGDAGCEAFELSREAAEQLRDQLTEALGPKVEAPRVWITPPTGTGTATFPKDTIIGFPTNCTCNLPWMGTVPRICPVHGRVEPFKVTCGSVSDQPVVMT